MAIPTSTDALSSSPLPQTTRGILTNCTAFILPDNGTLVVDNVTLTVTGGVVFTPACTSYNGNIVQPTSSVSNIKPPFHASETPQAYATGAATVLAWMLVVMLIVTPRTFFVGGVGGGVGLLGRRGIISGAQGRTSVIGVGSRPWLQKVAAISVAISLTIITVDTFHVAQRQYNAGFMNIESLRNEVTNSTQIKISRMISDIFLWLAQIQTLIRLFPRHKEKVLIKWIGFGLIIFDTTFTCLNSFAAPNFEESSTFRKAIPTLSDTFQLALSLMYSASVIYYVIRKRRYAFYHSLMWNVSVVAFLSILSLATPLIFFIIDIANKSIAGWGDYFRWVGLAAASVIVWEWVERIEALEREEKKDGILGREIFDEDDSDNDHGNLSRRRRFGGSRGVLSNQSSVRSSALDIHGSEAADTLVARPRPTQPADSQRLHRSLTFDTTNVPARRAMMMPARQTISPVNRVDTASPASTVYTVQYNTFNLIHPPITRHVNNNTESQNQTVPPRIDTQTEVQPVEDEAGSPGVSDGISEDVGNEKAEADTESASRQTKSHWFSVPSFFKRSKPQPPPQLRQGQVIDPVALQPAGDSEMASSRPNWDLRARLAAERGLKINDLPVTIVPPPPRGARNRRPWSPDQVETRQNQEQDQQPNAAIVPGPSRQGADASSSVGNSSQAPSEA